MSLKMDLSSVHKNIDRGWLPDEKSMRNLNVILNF